MTEPTVDETLDNLVETAARERASIVSRAVWMVWEGDFDREVMSVWNTPEEALSEVKRCMREYSDSEWYFSGVPFGVAHDTEEYDEILPELFKIEREVMQEGFKDES